MSSNATSYATARARLAEIVFALIALRVEDDAEAREMALAEFMASTGWPERLSRRVLEVELRETSLSPVELEEQTAKLLLRFHRAARLEPLAAHEPSS